MLLSVSKQTFPKAQGQLMNVTGVLSGAVMSHPKRRLSQAPHPPPPLQLNKKSGSFQNLLQASGLRGGSLDPQRATSTKAWN